MGRMVGISPLTGLLRPPYGGSEMTIETAKTAQRGGSRALGMKTWLGAGALTLGVGAALAGATAVAPADTGGHAASSSAASSSSTKSDAGPRRGTAASARKVAKVSTAPASAVASSKPSAKAPKAAADPAIPPINIDTPFGP